MKHGIVHLGVGNFHRAHQAVYSDQILSSGDLRWGIVGASLRSGATKRKLAPQDFLYTVQSRDSEAVQSSIIGSLKNVLLCTEQDQRSELLRVIAHPDTQVITLTITEAGYNRKAGQFDTDDPLTQHDMHQPDTPRTAPGIICEGLRRRASSGAGPLTVLSCDNLLSNGQATRQAVTTLLQHQSPELLGWLSDQVSFPSSMVDRIVPATTSAHLDEAEHTLGYRDEALVVCEPFTQWTIEDHFAGQRPPYDLGDATFVSNVVPFESAKLMLLNATHTALAYLGLLLDYDYIHEVMQDMTIVRLVMHMMDKEITPVVTTAAGLNLDAYKTSILARFRNSAVPYRTAQVGTDGSLKLQQRVLPTIKKSIANGGSTSGLSAVIACWLQCLRGRSMNGRHIYLQDAGGTELPTIAPTLDAQTLSRTFADLFSESLGENREVIEAEVRASLKIIEEKGPYGLTSLIHTN